MEVPGEYLPWPRSDLGSGFRPGLGSFHKLPGHSRGPRSKGLAPLSSVSGPSGGPDQAMLLHSPPQEGVSRVWSGPTLVTHPRGRQTSPPSGERYVGTRGPPPPAPAGGSCHPSQRGFLHISPTSGPASRRPEGGVSPPLTGHGARPGTRILCPPPHHPLGGVLWDTPTRGSIARERPGARERPRVGAHKTVTAERCSGVPGLP